LSKSRYCGDLRLKLARARGSRKVQKRDGREGSKTRVVGERSDASLNRYSLYESQAEKDVIQKLILDATWIGDEVMAQRIESSLMRLD
jgi:hypothetical protein